MIKSNILYYPKMQFKNKAFTLVELIIVITILAILATIAFVSFQNYTKDARDSTRLTTLRNIENGLQLFQIGTANYPLPDDFTQILSNSTLIGYQGYISDNISKLIKLNKTPIDGVVGKYIYSTNLQKNKYQVLTYLEKQIAGNNFSKTYALDYNQFQPISVGDKIGIILNVNNSNISQSIFDVDTVSTQYKAFFGKKYLVGTGKILQVIRSTMLNKNINLLGDNCCTFEDNTSNGFILYGITGENIFSIMNETNYLNQTSRKSLYIKTSLNMNLGGTYGGVYMTGINLTTLTPGLDYTISYNARMLSPNVKINFSLQNGLGDENCLSHEMTLSKYWTTYSYSCVLNELKGNLYIRGPQSSEFQIDDLVIQPSVLVN